MQHQTHSQSDSIDLIGYLKLMWQKRWIIILISGVFAVVSVIYVINLDNIYKSNVTLIPQSEEKGSSKFSGLAALAGIDLNSSSTSNELLYQDILMSDQMLNKLIDRKWFVKSKNKEMYIYDFLKFEMNPEHYAPKEKLYFDTKRFFREDVIEYSSSPVSGLMVISVSIPLEPFLAADIANWLAEELHNFNEGYRKNKADENLMLINKQLNEAKNELYKTENVLRDFQKSNKDYSQSEELQIEYERLQREVITENTIYTELRKQFEFAKIDLEKSKNTIVVLDKATVPVKKDQPKRSLICMMFTIFGGLVAIVYVVIENYVKKLRSLA